MPRFSQVKHLFPDCCIDGIGSKNKQGYLDLGVGGSKKKLINRIICRAFNGPMASCHVVMHTCDNPGCINPKHLLAGTQKENMTDAAQKGRLAHGEFHPLVKLTDARVLDIRRSKESSASLARRYGVSHSTIRAVRTGRSWKTVGAERSL